MPINTALRIPSAMFDDHALRMRGQLKTDPDKWTDYEIEELRHQCGPEYATIPLQNIRNQLEVMRKDAQLGRTSDSKNRGATSVPEPPQWYQEYLRTPRWKTFRQRVLEFWAWRCALCYSEARLDVHHRTYERLREERLTDCIALCRECHLAAERRKDRLKKNLKAEARIASLLF